MKHNIDEAVERIIRLEHHVEMHIERNKAFEANVREFMKHRQERDDKLARRVWLLALPLFSLLVSGLVYIIRLEGDIEIIRYRIEAAADAQSMSETLHVPSQTVSPEP